MLNREVSAAKRRRVNELQDGSIDYRLLQLHAIERKCGVSAPKGFTVVHDANRRVVSFHDESNLGLGDEKRAGWGVVCAITGAIVGARLGNSDRVHAGFWP